MSRQVPKELSEKANPKIYHLLLEVEAFERELLGKGEVEMSHKMTEFDGKLTEVTQTSGFPFELRKEFSDNPKKYIGRVVELGGYQVFASGAMRHSSFLRFREDREPKDCV